MHNPSTFWMKLKMCPQNKPALPAVRGTQATALWEPIWNISTSPSRIVWSHYKPCCLKPALLYCFAKIHEAKNSHILSKCNWQSTSDFSEDFPPHTSWRLGPWPISFTPLQFEITLYLALILYGLLCSHDQVLDLLFSSASPSPSASGCQPWQSQGQCWLFHEEPSWILHLMASVCQQGGEKKDLK